MVCPWTRESRATPWRQHKLHARKEQPQHQLQRQRRCLHPYTSSPIHLLQSSTCTRTSAHALQTATPTRLLHLHGRRRQQPLNCSRTTPCRAEGARPRAPCMLFGSPSSGSCDHEASTTLQPHSLLLILRLHPREAAQDKWMSARAAHHHCQ